MITVSPTRDMGIMNSMINHPDVAPHIRDDATGAIGDVDMSVLNLHTNVFLRVDFDGIPVGFAAMLHRGDNVYEQHSGILKSFRGHHALRAGREVVKWMFLNTDCATVSTWAWSSAKHVMMMARAVGFVEECRSKWQNTVGGASVDRVVYAQTMIEWSRRAKDDFVEDSLRMNLGVEPQMIGLDAIFARIALNAHIDKAERFYNRWAAVLNAQPIRVLAFRAGSLVLNSGSRVVEVTPQLVSAVIQGDSTPCQQSHT